MNHKKYLIALTLLITTSVVSCAGVDPTTFQESEEDQKRPDTNLVDIQDTSDIDKVNINLSKPQQLPSDIPEHLVWGGRGGAGFSGCISINDMESTADIFDYYLPGGWADWCFCDLNEDIGELISAYISFPSGSVKSLEETVIDPLGEGKEKCVMFAHQFSTSTDENLHSFETELSGRRVSEDFVPYVDVYPIFGWGPNEGVRILVFNDKEGASDAGSEDKFVMEHKARADKDGNLWIKFVNTNGITPVIFAVGEFGTCKASHPADINRFGYPCENEGFFDRDKQEEWEGWQYEPSAD